VATLTVINGALQNENETLRHEASSASPSATALQAELDELQEEFTRRLATADRTIAGLKVISVHSHACMSCMDYHPVTINTSLCMHVGGGDGMLIHLLSL